MFGLCIPCEREVFAVGSALIAFRTKGINNPKTILYMPGRKGMVPVQAGTLKIVV